jgi:hypothetical protein
MDVRTATPCDDSVLVVNAVTAPYPIGFCTREWKARFNSERSGCSAELDDIFSYDISGCR